MLSDSPHCKQNDLYLPVVVSYFHKKLPSGELVDINDPFLSYCCYNVQDLTKISSVELSVLPSLVDNGDKVTVTWMDALVSKRQCTGYWTTYEASDMCDEPANNTAYIINPFYLCDVLLTDLKPNTLYYYQYGSDYIFSDIEQFTSAPPVGSDQSFKFVSYGDMGIAFPGAEVTVELIKQEINEGANFVIHQGNLSYTVGYANIWEQ